MKKKTAVFSEEEAKTLKNAQKILKKVQKKYDNWVDKNLALDGSDWEGFIEAQAELHDWLDRIFAEGGIDICGCELFIKH